MRSISVARTSVIASILIAGGVLLYLAFPDHNANLWVKLIALTTFFGMVNLFAFSIYFMALGKETWPNGLRLAYWIACLLFPIVWLLLIPVIIPAARSDALGGLSMFLGLMAQALIWFIAFVVDSLICRMHPSKAKMFPYEKPSN